MAQKRAEPEPPPVPREHDVETLKAFLDQGRSLAEWHRHRSENFESKAGTILGISGVLLALTTVTVGPVGDLRGRWQVAVGVLIALGAASFLASALFAIHTLTLRMHQFSSVGQLRRVWDDYREHATKTEREVIGMFADSLISPISGDKSSIESLVQDADARGRNVKRSIRLLFVGFPLMTAAGAILFVEVLVR